MNERIEVDVAGTGSDQGGEVVVEAAILGLLRQQLFAVADREGRAALRQDQGPVRRLDADVPGLRTGLPPVELGREATRVARIPALTATGRWPRRTKYRVSAKPSYTS